MDRKIRNLPVDERLKYYKRAQKLRKKKGWSYAKIRKQVKWNGIENYTGSSLLPLGLATISILGLVTPSIIDLIFAGIAATAGVYLLVSGALKNRIKVRKHSSSDTIRRPPETEYPFRRLTLEVRVKNPTHEPIVARVVGAGPEELDKEIEHTGTPDLFWYGTFNAHPKEDETAASEIDSGGKLIEHYRNYHIPAGRIHPPATDRRMLNLIWKVKDLEDFYLATTTGDKITFEGKGWIDIEVATGGKSKRVRVHIRHKGGTEPDSLILESVEDL